MRHTETQTASWSRRRRLEFIDFRLLWEGTVNRGELVDHFEISTQQASSDLAEYLRAAPKNLLYDTRAKTYRATSTFAPLFGGRDAGAYLSQLISIVTKEADPQRSLIGWHPPFDIVRHPARVVSFAVLKAVLVAIRNREDLRVEYQSMRRPQLSQRWIAPHALASDGQRVHLRAWCHENKEFRDFVLSRVHAPSARRSSSIDPLRDVWWHCQTEILVRASSYLSADQRKAIEGDFGMKKGRLAITCRKALGFYVLRQLRLDLGRADRDQPLELIETPEVIELLKSGKKSTQLRGDK